MRLKATKKLTSIEGKTILFICPAFYEYKDKLVEALNNAGAEVICIENKMHKEDWRCSMNYLTSFLFFLINPFYKAKYVNEILHLVGGKRIDVLFVINGFSINNKLIKHIKLINPDVITYLFLWDSLCYWKYSNIIKYFDIKYSFDHGDCERYAHLGLKYHPDFYIDPGVVEVPVKYDLVHIGALHQFASDRLRYLSSVVSFAEKNNLSYYIMLYVPLLSGNRLKRLMHWMVNICGGRNFLRYWKELRKYKSEKFIAHEKLSLQEVFDIESSARCIIDMPPSLQKGCTIRSLQALALGKKLITSNESIRQDSFYDSRNVLILNKQGTNLNTEFLKDSFTGCDISTLKIENWIKSILLC